MEAIASKVQNLGDLELAILLSLVAEIHCIITTDGELVDDLAQELLIVRIFRSHNSHRAAADRGQDC